MDRITKIRCSSFAAHVVPLGLFVAMLALPGLIKNEHSLAPWWRQHPEQWLYPLQVLVGAGLLAFWWRRYEWGKRGGSEWAWGIALGVLAGILWVLPCELWYRLDLGSREGSTFQLWFPGEDSRPWWQWFGAAERTEGFNPADAPFPLWLALGLRFLRMVVVVALVEEIFWRGFLMRKLGERDGEDWTEVPIGHPGWKVWAGTTALAILAHQPVDWISSLIFFSIGYGLCVWRRSVLVCVVFHGVTNLVLGLYAWNSGHYGLW